MCTRVCYLGTAKYCKFSHFRALHTKYVHRNNRDASHRPSFLFIFLLRLPVLVLLANCAVSYRTVLSETKYPPLVCSLLFLRYLSDHPYCGFVNVCFDTQPVFLCHLFCSVKYVCSLMSSASLFLRHWRLFRVVVIVCYATAFLSLDLLD